MYTKTGRTTIKQVASVAGVSTQTVSRVINNRPDVSSETRKHIQDVIEKLAYQPSALARSLIHQRSYTLGVVTACLKYFGPSCTLNGITAAAEEAGYALILKELSCFDSDTNEPIFQALVSRHVDGIIWAVQEVGENRSWVNQLALDSDIPIVYLTMEPRENISVVLINNYMGGCMAMSHLLDQGYRHIGHISGPLDWWEARQRMKAWKDALEEAGIGFHDHSWVEGNWSSASGARAAEKLFEQYTDMDSILVANDQMALGAIQIVHQKGLQIPQDIGIVGFDNIPESAFYWPALTTVNHDQYNLGRVAVQETIKIIESVRQGLTPISLKSITLEPTLVVRDSSLRLKV